MTYPAAFYLGSLAWQVSRRCAACSHGWEVGPVSWIFITPNVEGAELTIPTHLYAGYLSRFSFHATSDLSATEVALQGIGPKLGPRGWADLARAPYDPASENALFVKLPAGHHKLRVNFYAPGVSQGLPNQEVLVEKPVGPWSTGARDDGRYASIPVVADPGRLTFEITGGGKVLRDLRGPVPTGCQGALPGTASTVSAHLWAARVAPDGTVVGRALRPGEPSTYLTLAGRLRHRRFNGTVTAAVGPCIGIRQFGAAPSDR